MMYAVWMGSGAMIYIPSFMKNGLAIQKLLWGIHIQTHRQHGDRIRQESRLKIKAGL
jgi:hypothetical protein